MTEEDKEKVIKKFVGFLSEIPLEDPEIAHGMADGLLCQALEELGCPEISEAFEEISGDFWYA